MDIEDEEILNLLKLFTKNEVKYILVGGFAVSLHGYSRFTADIDIWIKDNKINRENLYKALLEFGLSLDKSFQNIDFVPGWSTIYLSSGMELDIMSYLKGLPQDEFDDSYNLAVVASIHEVPVRFLHLNQLIEAKKASARPQDLLDVEELEKIYRTKKP